MFLYWFVCTMEEKNIYRNMNNAYLLVVWVVIYFLLIFWVAYIFHSKCILFFDNWKWKNILKEGFKKKTEMEHTAI